MPSRPPPPAPTLRHAPYDGGAPAFAIGAAPIEETDWLEPEPGLSRCLAEKDALFAEKLGQVFAAEPEGSDAAQAEVLRRIAEHLPARYPALYRRDGAALRIEPVDRAVALDADAPPLLTASRLVAEDLLIMARAPDAADAPWRLVAGALCFPTYWSLREKLGRPMDEIHRPVPGFGPGTRNASVIARMFDRLQPNAIVARMNWSITGRGDLALPQRHGSEPVEALLSTPHIRVERQTLRKLPESGAILFTVRIHVDGFEALEAHPNAPRLAAGLIDALEGMSDTERAYKNLEAARPSLLRRLGAVVQRGADGSSPRR